MKFILAPIDFSEGTPRVVDEAAKLAGARMAHVILIHVVQPPRWLGVARCGGRTDLLAAMEAEAERGLLALRADLLRRGVNAHALRLTGNPRARIVEQAKKLEPLCIVIGSHGRNAFRELVLGGTVSGVLKQASCPVVVVPLRRSVGAVKRAVRPRRLVPAMRL